MIIQELQLQFIKSLLEHHEKEMTSGLLFIKLTGKKSQKLQKSLVQALRSPADGTPFGTSSTYCFASLQITY